MLKVKLKKMIFVSMSLLLCMSLIGVSPSEMHSSAENVSSSAMKPHSSLSQLTVEAQVNHISLKWPQIAAHTYEIEYNDEVIFSGESDGFTHDQLESDYMYGYLISEFDMEGNQVDIVFVRVDTLPEPVTIRKKRGADSADDSTTEPPHDTVDIVSEYKVFQDRIWLDWNDLPKVKEYQVYRDDQWLATTQESQYTDTQFNPDQSHRYEIKAEGESSELRKQWVKQQMQEQGITLSIEDEQLLFAKPYSIIFMIDPANQQLSERSKREKRSILANKTFKIRYTTFIPAPRAPNPFAQVRHIKYFSPAMYVISSHIAKYETFGGDEYSREFIPNRNSYRTRTDVEVQFNAVNRQWSNVPTVKMNKYVGETTGYDKRGRLVGRATDSGNGIQLGFKELRKDRVKYYVTHDSANPLLPTPKAYSPAIDYYYEGFVQQDGYYQFDGWHDQAPSHEMFIMLPGSSYYKTIHTHDNKGFHYLTPFFDKRTISVRK
jgi:hypothetical protein